MYGDVIADMSRSCSRQRRRRESRCSGVRWIDYLLSDGIHDFHYFPSRSRRPSPSNRCERIQLQDNSNKSTKSYIYQHCSLANQPYTRKQWRIPPSSRALPGLGTALANEDRLGFVGLLLLALLVEASFVRMLFDELIRCRTHEEQGRRRKKGTNR